MTLPERLRELAEWFNNEDALNAKETCEEASAIIERLPSAEYFWRDGSSTTYETVDEAMEDCGPGEIVELRAAFELPTKWYVRIEEEGEIVEYDTREAAEKARGG